MKKQPDKLEVLMDWFLGDAKEINVTQKKCWKNKRHYLSSLTN